MMTAWRCVKMSTHHNYNYVALEFDMSTGEMNKVIVNSKNTDVRKRKTVEFELHEITSSGVSYWMTIPYSEVPSLMRDFNKVRMNNNLPPLQEADVLKSLYALEALR